MAQDFLACDGCGQLASSGHIARRLQRLEWTTRWRPIHIGALLVGGISPQSDADFLYAGKFQGEAGRVLDAVGIAVSGRPSETVLAEFQRGGFFLTYALECPLDNTLPRESQVASLLDQRFGFLVARVRRSLKPKKVVLVSSELAPIAGRLASEDLGCPVGLDDGKPFDIGSSISEGAVLRLREALGTITSSR
jgi:hypothetical protein